MLAIQCKINRSPLRMTNRTRVIRVNSLSHTTHILITLCILHILTTVIDREVPILVIAIIVMKRSIVRHIQLVKNSEEEDTQVQAGVKVDLQVTRE